MRGQLDKDDLKQALTAKSPVYFVTVIGTVSKLMPKWYEPANRDGALKLRGPFYDNYFYAWAASLRYRKKHNIED
jgi:hypothetical protein